MTTITTGANNVEATVGEHQRRTRPLPFVLAGGNLPAGLAYSYDECFAEGGRQHDGELSKQVGSVSSVVISSSVLFLSALPGTLIIGSSRFHRT